MENPENKIKELEAENKILKDALGALVAARKQRQSSNAQDGKYQQLRKQAWAKAEKAMKLCK